LRPTYQQIPSYLRAPSGRRVLYPVDEVNHDLIGAEDTGKLLLARRFVTQDHHLGPCAARLRGRPTGPIRYAGSPLRCTGDSTQPAAPEIRLHPTLELPALRHEAFNQLHLRALPQIVGARLEAQTELRNFLFAVFSTISTARSDMLALVGISDSSKGSLSRVPSPYR